MDYGTCLIHGYLDISRQFVYPNKCHICIITLSLGLAFIGISVNHITPVFETIIEEGLVPSPIFGVFLSRDLNSKEGGVISFGGIDPIHRRGQPLTVKLTRNMWYYFVMKNVNNKYCKETSSCTAIADTGTSLLVGPVDTVKDINENVIGKF